MTSQIRRPGTIRYLDRDDRRLVRNSTIDSRAIFMGWGPRLSV
jgi:hypothetical protein